MINDLAEFISILLNKKHEIIVDIDANEANDQPKNSVDKLLQLTKLIDVISQQHGIRIEPNTHIRGRKRVEFLLCSEHIYTFIDKSGITPFNEITSSDHRGFFLLKNSYVALPDHSSRPLQSSNTKNVLSYKRHLKKFVVHHKIIEQATAIQKKLVNKSITPKDHIIINKLDVLLTKGMNKAERMITKYGPQFPWSPKLAIAIIELAIWKLIKSALKTKTSRDIKIIKLTSRLQSLDTTYSSHIINHERTNMKIINKNITQASQSLKKIQKNSRTIREDYLKEKVQEAKIDSNKKHYQYLSNLILIEHQQQMHRRIKHHTHQRKSSGIKYLDIPTDTSIPWNNIPSNFPDDKWKKVENPEDIERCLISRNHAHLFQASSPR